ncbi:MAG: GTPase Era [Coxiella sp. (in: Bacteria)]|nr:MAG: GTPase Era [Coxiella sp. (in: g-proteobacteria)]
MKFGYVALVGRPNVGKSTLLNRFLAKKLSITSKKPQTTRHRIMGIKTWDDIQLVFVDTPGIHLGEKKALNRYMNRAALNTLTEVDVILFMVAGTVWNEEDKWVLKKLKAANVPVILVINKIDLIKQRAELLPFIEKRKTEFDYHAIVPISAIKGDQVEELQLTIVKDLNEDVHYYDPDQFTDRSDRFVASEIVREKLMRHLGQELPYDLTVTIEAFEEDPKIIKIAAVIWVERDGQKAIVIGKGGAMLKNISSRARVDMETYFEKKVFLKTWVKVKNNWSDDERALNQLGYNND